MPIQRPQLVNNEIYHIIVRGVGDTSIFNDINDHYRAVFSLYEFNTTKSVVIRDIREHRKRAKIPREQFSVKNRELFSGDFGNQDFLIKILAFYFMPNHIHLLIEQFKDDGITRFMRKFGAGYATYFNKKYNRKGHLFQGRFRAVHIKSNEQLRIVFVYIHTNGISLIEPKWKEKGIENPEKVIKFLEDYKWSSYPDYIGKKNFPSLTERDFLLEVMGGEKGCKEFVENWVKYKGEIKDFDDLSLE